jgi:hypothetical protein
MYFYYILKLLESVKTHITNIRLNIIKKHGSYYIFNIKI